MERKSKLKVQFNSIVNNMNDPTLVEATMIVHDFELSENNQIITEEVCRENMKTLINKRIVCNYISSEDNGGLDALTDHEEKIATNRNGEEVIITDTIAIGFINDVYIGDYVDENGYRKKVLFAKATLWNDDKYRDIVELLKEWINNNIKIHMSVEYIYLNYNVQEGVEYIQSPIFYTGHCLLNSEDRNDYCEILPAYDISQVVSLNQIKNWNKAVNNIKNKLKSNNKREENEEMEKKNQMFEYLKSNNAISAGSLRYRILEQLEKVMVAEEYNNMWLSDYDIYPTENYFIYETWTEEIGWKLYKVTFSVDENDVVTVNYDDKIEVKEKFELVEVQKSLNSKEKEVEKLNNDIKELEKSLNSKDEEIINAIKDKEALDKKLNESNELVISLNSKVDDLNKTIETMKPIVEEYEKEEFEKALNSTKEAFREKFEKVGALDVFEQEDTQELIKRSVNAKTDEYKYQLNQLIIDNIKADIKNDESGLIKSTNSLMESRSTKDLTKDFSNIYEDISGIDID